MTATSLPFELDRDEIRGHHVPARGIRGTVRVVGETILIEFRLEGTTADRAAHQLQVPIADLTKIAMTGGALKSPRLLLEVQRAELLGPLPWADGCMCVLRFRRAHGVALRQLIEEVEVRMAELAARRRKDPD